MGMTTRSRARSPARVSKAATNNKKSVTTTSSWWPNGFAGISSGGLFGPSCVPSWVDATKPAGTTSISAQLGFAQTAHDVIRLNYFFWSPNLIWFSLIAVTMYYFFPYPIDEARERGIAASWVLRRFAVNWCSCFAYYAFFHVGLYWRNWSGRKFRPGSYPTAGNMAHNLYYWSLAIVQWTFWEAVMVRLWATGAVAYDADADVLASPWALAKNAAFVLAIPLWRDLHFYVAHRFIHIRAVYKYVHSLHHRNADPEPFSGMSMHPVEHLYYFSCAFIPSLYIGLSPLIFCWNFVHLTFAPGAGHSGWEDHWQADTYHYIHHAKFECNYGSPTSSFIDQFFGTFREKLGKAAEYKGEWNEKHDEGTGKDVKAKVWSRTGYLGWPASWDHCVYTVFWLALFVVGWWGAAGNHAGESVAGVPVAPLLGVVIAYSPVAVAMLLAWVSGDRLSYRWPFHKEKIVGSFGFFVAVGWLFCILPMYHAITWVC